jgi:galactokinase
MMSSKLTLPVVRLDDNVWTNYLKEGYQSIEIKGFEFEGFNCVFAVIFQLVLVIICTALECGFYLD